MVLWKDNHPRKHASIQFVSKGRKDGPSVPTRRVLGSTIPECDIGIPKKSSSHSIISPSSGADIDINAAFVTPRTSSISPILSRSFCPKWISNAFLLSANTCWYPDFAVDSRGGKHSEVISLTA